MKVSRNLFIFMCIWLLASCTNLDRLGGYTIPNTNDFHAVMAREYLAFAMHEADRYDWYDSEYFAKKGLKAARGEVVYPEIPDEW